MMTQFYLKNNFKFNKNEHIIITGPNGSGKSTCWALCQECHQFLKSFLIQIEWDTSDQYL